MSNGPARSLAGEIAIVTGGSRGIGRAIVELFLQHGAAVVFCGRDPAAGRSAEENLGPMPRRADGQARGITAALLPERDVMI